jgi:hypothetical protein
MPDDIDKRVRFIEDEHREQKMLYKHMSETLDRIGVDIRAALDLKGKVDDHTGQLKKLWEKVDVVQELRNEFNIVKSEHAKCQPKVDILDDHAMGCDYRLKTLEETVRTAKGFALGQFGTLLSYLIPLVLGAALAYAWSKGVAK